MGNWCFLRNSNWRRTVKTILLVNKLLGLVEMTFGLVNACFSLPEWQAVKMIFFAPWRCLGRREEKDRVRVRVSPNNQSDISLPVLVWAVTCCWYWRENKTNYNVRWMVQTLPEKKTITEYFIHVYWRVGTVTQKNSIPGFCNKRNSEL